MPVRVLVPLLVAAGLLCWWLLRDSDVPPPPDEVVHAEEKQPSPRLPADPIEAERDTSSEPVVEPVDYGDEPADADLEHPYGFELSVHMRGPLGLPVDGARVFLAPEESGFSQWPEESRAGMTRLAWRGRTRTMRVQVAVTAWGILQPIRSIVVEADQQARVAFSVRGRGDVLSALRQELDGGKYDVEKLREVLSRQKLRRLRMDWLDVECGRTMVEYKFHKCTECHDRSFVAPYQSVAHSGTMAPSLHKQSCFEDLRRSRMHGAAAEKKLAELEEAREQQKQERMRKARNYRATLVGRVELPDGSAKKGMTVAWVDESGAVLLTTRTDARGKYRLGPMAGGEQRVIVAAGPLGGSDRSVRVVRTGKTVANFTLSTNQFVIGKLLDEGGDPLKDWRVELVRDTGGWATMTSTDDAGSFAAYGVPGPVECLVWPRGLKKPFPVLFGVQALVDASAIELALRQDQPIRARLRVRAALPSSRTRARIDARVTQIDTGRVAHMVPYHFANEFTLEPLSPGIYSVQLGAPGHAWKTREIHVDGRGLWNIGSLHLAAPGRVRIVQLPGAPDLMQYPHAFYRRSDAVDVRVDYEVDRGVLVMAPGRHVLVWQANGDLRSREFEVVSNSEVEIPIWPE